MKETFFESITQDRENAIEEIQDILTSRYEIYGLRYLNSLRKEVMDDCKDKKFTSVLDEIIENSNDAYNYLSTICDGDAELMYDCAELDEIILDVLDELV